MVDLEVKGCWRKNGTETNPFASKRVRIQALGDCNYRNLV